MKTTKALYWIFTGLIFLLAGVVPLLTFNAAAAKQGISHLGYPEYFRVTLALFEIAGSLILILPIFKGRVKEWTYAGFTFNFVFAFISHMVVDGLDQAIAPMIGLALLAGSYFCYHKLNPTS